MIKKEVTDLRSEFNSIYCSLENRLLDLADLLLKTALASGYRFVEIHQHIYMVSSTTVVNVENYDAVQESTELDMSYVDSDLFNYIWGQVHGDLQYYKVMNIERLIEEAKLDPKDFDIECTTVQEEIALVRRLYDTYGPNLFQFRPEVRKRYEQHIPPYEGQRLEVN